jgi:hypothetical protein
MRDFLSAMKETLETMEIHPLYQSEGVAAG